MKTPKLLPILLIALASCVQAAPTRCPNLFAGGQAPDLLSPALASHAHVLCYDSYSVVESGVSLTPVWSAEHLTRESVAEAHQQPRIDAFHPEPSISPRERAEHGDFVRSGWDEGHMSPSGDAPTMQAQFQTFSLVNISPQSPDNNRHLWQGIEISTRALAKYDGDVYVVTGPAFVGPRGLLNGRVEIPTHIWKAVFDSRRGAAAYITLNRPGYAYTVVSIAEFTRITGIDPFPALSASVKANAMALPTPRPGGQRLDVAPLPEQALGLGAPDQVSSITGPIVQVAADPWRSRERSFSRRAEGQVAGALFRSWSY